MIRIGCVTTSVLAFSLAMSSMATAQQGGVSPFGWQQNSLGQSIYWIMTPQIQKELEMVSDQVDRLKQAQVDSQQRLREAYQQLGEVPAEDRQAKYLEIYRQANEATEKQVRKILLPHQIDRLRQILLQQRLAQLQWGSAAAITDEVVVEELGITEAQQKQLRERERELRQEIQKKTREFYQKLQDESREKMLEVLTSAQRRRLDALTGEKFQWQTTWPQGGGGTGGKSPVQAK